MTLTKIPLPEQQNLKNDKIITVFNTCKLMWKTFDKNHPSRHARFSLYEIQYIYDQVSNSVFFGLRVHFNVNYWQQIWLLCVLIIVVWFVIMSLLTSVSNSKDKVKSLIWKLIGRFFFVSLQIWVIFNCVMLQLHPQWGVISAY